MNNDYIANISSILVYGILFTCPIPLFFLVAIRSAWDTQIIKSNANWKKFLCLSMIFILIPIAVYVIGKVYGNTATTTDYFLKWPWRIIELLIFGHIPLVMFFMFRFKSQKWFFLPLSLFTAWLSLIVSFFSNCSITATSP